MKLSVIIVNYNVKYFLEQCLYSVRKAANLLPSEIEIFVVDNNSADGSCAMVKQKFAEVYLIENKQNTGFSRANNQAIRLAKGKYVLLLNPDTVVQEETFVKIVNFMDSHSEAGGLGVKMIDGNGNFLPESKRSLPTPAVAFYKIFGFSKIFPKSKTFGKYHLTYLDKEKTNEVEILSGAFMLLRKEMLDKIGLLDETFFMYGEDIDLSYRILKAGYKNFYFPETTIIHYKGESTKKNSVNYVLVFYEAMLIFAKKHFSQQNAKIFSYIIKFAVYFRAFLSLLKRFIDAIFLPFCDSTFIFLGYFFLAPFWELYKFGKNDIYPTEYWSIVVPFYIFIWLISLYLSRGYEKPFKFFDILKGLTLGTIAILLIYALLSEKYRYSRALILLGFAYSVIILMFFRTFLHFLKFQNYQFSFSQKKRLLIVGNVEQNEILNLLKQSEIHFEVVDFVSPSQVSSLREMVKMNKIDEIIFSADSLSSQEIIENMWNLADCKVAYKIIPPENVAIIGSHSIFAEEHFYELNMNAISKPQNRLRKRFLDISVSLCLFLFFPIFIFAIINKKKYFLNIFNVLRGKNTFVGYVSVSHFNEIHLPRLKKGVLTVADSLPNIDFSSEILQKLNMNYAKNYKLRNDLLILFLGFKHLGREI